MATKKVCDRCGTEIKPHKVFMYNSAREVDIEMNWELERYGPMFKKWELCKTCADAVKKFIEDYKGEKEG